MLPIPSPLREIFDKCLENRKIPDNLQSFYKKWLRYYLDFCNKYNFPPAHTGSLTQFIRKLQEKKQSKELQDQAIIAVTLYYEIINAKDSSKKITLAKSASSPDYIHPKNDKTFSVRETAIRSDQYKDLTTTLNVSSKPVSLSENKYFIQETGASWIKEYTKLDNEIRVRHYSSKTLATYKGWVHKFQAFTKSKPPESLSQGNRI